MKVHPRRKIKEGSLVQLKSGGPIHTVTQVVLDNETGQWCADLVRYDQYGSVHRVRLPKTTIVCVSL